MLWFSYISRHFGAQFCLLPFFVFPVFSATRLTRLIYSYFEPFNKYIDFKMKQLIWCKNIWNKICNIPIWNSIPDIYIKHSRDKDWPNSPRIWVSRWPIFVISWYAIFRLTDVVPVDRKVWRLSSGLIKVPYLRLLLARCIQHDGRPANKAIK